MVVSSLIAANYTKPQPHVIEALVLHLYGEYSCIPDANPSAWVLLAMIIRLGMKMGYHRNQEAMSSLTPFQVRIDSILVLA
jgi:hypothetical protein